MDVTTPNTTPNTTTTVTAAHLSAMPRDGMRRELVAGELRMMSPSGWRHGKVVGWLHTQLGSHVQQHKLGVVFGAETGFLLSRQPDTVRAPDIAFIAHENLPSVEPNEAYWPGAPDLAVEVRSPRDTSAAVAEKVEAWLAAGCRLVWVVDPQQLTVTIHRSTDDVQIQAVDEKIVGGDIVAGFSCAIADIFAAT